MTESPWIPVGELAQAFAPEGNTLPPTEDLVGRAFSLHFEDGTSADCRFETVDRLSFSGAEETYLATKVREGLYFVDFVHRNERAASATLLLDLNRGIVTALEGRLPDEVEARRPLADRVAGGEELTAVSVAFRSGAVGAPFGDGTPRHPDTGDLVGRRVEYAYSPTERYEHIYLNDKFYTWHCVAGSEKGLADTDRCHYRRLGDDLYLFVWREKIVPTLGVVVVDFQRLKTTGKIFGYRGNDFREVSNFPIGAYARVLNVTERGEGPT